MLENGSLVIVDAVRDDEGEYMCSASSTVASISSHAVHVRVRTPAHFVHKFQSLASKVGERVTLSCEASGDEPMTVTWMHKNQLISNSMPSLNQNSGQKFVLQDSVTKDRDSQSVRKSTLVLESTSLSDTGLYSCTASNAFGREERKVQLVVQSVPEPPVGLRVVQIGSRRVTIDWKTGPTDGNSAIVHYLVHYKKSTGSWSQDHDVLTVSGSETSAVITGLSPSTEYKMRLQAVNSLGASQATSDLLLTTDDEGEFLVY